MSRASKGKKLIIFLGSILLFCLSVSPVLAASIPSGFNVWQSNTTENTKKAWTVKFNKELNSITVNSSNIYVTDANNKRVDTKLTLSTDKFSVNVAPIASYKIGEEYRLFITGGVKSQKESLPLSKPIVVPFFVVADSNSKIPLITNKSYSLLTKFTVIASSDVYSVYINQTPMDYNKGNIYTQELSGLLPDDVVTVYAFDSKGLKLEEQKYTVK